MHHNPYGAEGKDITSDIKDHPVVSNNPVPLSINN
jgi:hypothetical protein